MQLESKRPTYNKVDQIGTKWDISGTSLDQISEIFWLGEPKCSEIGSEKVPTKPFGTNTIHLEPKSGRIGG